MEPDKNFGLNNLALPWDVANLLENIHSGLD